MPKFFHKCLEFIRPAHCRLVVLSTKDSPVCTKNNPAIFGTGKCSFGTGGNGAGFLFCHCCKNVNCEAVCRWHVHRDEIYMSFHQA